MHHALLPANCKALLPCHRQHIAAQDEKKQAVRELPVLLAMTEARATVIIAYWEGHTGWGADFLDLCGPSLTMRVSLLPSGFPLLGAPFPLRCCN
eukprot:scaffold47500_cov19-Tisochrysis_lutea.AAC.2